MSPSSESSGISRHSHIQACVEGVTGRLPAISTAALTRVLMVSDYVRESLERSPGLVEELYDRGELARAPEPSDMQQRLAKALASCSDEASMAAVVRRLRRAWQIGIIWRDVCREESDVSSAWDTAAAVTRLAECMLSGVLAWLEQHLAPRWGRAWYRDGGPMSLIVLGMGKLGAGELNLSSDIDLIFAYTHDGTTSGGKRSLAHLDYFTRIGQRLIKVLDETTVEGYVFRVDMRLRPLGEGGPLVGSFASLDRYYQDQGREWERFALLKARPVAGDIEAGQALLDQLNPFVYRRYLDYGAIQSLREMKAMINREVRRRGLEHNIKLGAGGIREVEFIVQVFQLIRGGRDRQLQTPSLREALSQIGALALLPQSTVATLENDYLLLRDCEHLLQARDDRQTQELPTQSDGWEPLAQALGFNDHAQLISRLEEVRERVHALFEDVIHPSESDEDSAASESDELTEWTSLWQQAMEQADALAWLEQHDFVDADASLRRLLALKHCRAAQAMQRLGHERLNALMPLLLSSIVTEHQQTQAQQGEAAGNSTRLRLHYRDQSVDEMLARTLPLIEAVLGRSAYLSLLRESEGARIQLIRLCSASPWVAAELARYPHLLDELLTPATLYAAPDRESLEHALNLALLRIPEDDEEALLEALRLFKHAQVLSVAAADLSGLRPLMQVSDALTMIAEVVLEKVLKIAWRRLVARYGSPQGCSNGEEGVPGFCIVGYGKLGGIELGYASDLDLVFLHDASAQGTTDGANRQLDNHVFFTRLGQRIIHMLTALTPAGILYEVDMRLRPSGNSGLLVASLPAFADYQKHHAWIWEHQALVRARMVAGSQQLGQRFEQLRRGILGQSRERDTLREAVVNMRHKMREHLGSGTEGVTTVGHHLEEDEGSTQFDLKQDAGGMVDIEFIDQYAVLAYAHAHPHLLDFTDNIRILETLEHSGPWLSESISGLKDAYLEYRDVTHLNALNQRGSRVPGTLFQQQRANVSQCWQQWMEKGEC